MRYASLHDVIMVRDANRFWNIQAGGGSRVEGIARQIEIWAPDVVAFAEFRGALPGQRLAQYLRQSGFAYQLSTVEPQTPTVNALLLASTCPVERLHSFHTGFAPSPLAFGK